VTLSFLSDLEAALGPDAVRTNEHHDLSPHLHDWRGRYRGNALAVVFPSDTAAVARCVQACARHGKTIVPQGGNTGLVGGGVPDARGDQIVLNLQRLQRVRHIDPDNLSLTVEAGCTLAEVQAAAEGAGLLFPLSLAAEGSCTIGGNLATNAGGTQVLRYGTARELCLGLEAVSAEGEVWHGLHGLRKNNTGYDLRDLLIGSEGTLGIITAATLRLYPRPRSRQAAMLATPTPAHAVAMLRRARRHLDAWLTGFELMHRYPLELLARHVPAQAALATQMLATPPSIAGRQGPPAADWFVLLDAASPLDANALQAALEGLLSEALAEGEVLDAHLSQSGPQYRAMWGLREGIPLAEKAEATMVKHDIGVPTSLTAGFISEVEKALSHAFPGCRTICFGHLGDGNLHFNVQAPPGLSDADFLARHEADVNRIVYDLVQSLGGTYSAEHGVGQLKCGELASRSDPVALAWMQAIKHALDPAGRLNPGRVLAG
jgi:FAD/FMN-containing dehydrogenase